MSWSELLVALISAGLLTAIGNAVKWAVKQKHDGSPEAKQLMQITTVDQSLAVVARARDELEADNIRLRAERAETDARHAAELARRDAREALLQSEITRLEGKVREILAELEGLKRRHTGPDTNPRGIRATDLR